MAISFETAAGPSQCFLVGSLLVLVGVALPVVRTKLGKSAGFDGAPTLVELYNEGKGYHAKAQLRKFRAERELSSELHYSGVSRRGLFSKDIRLGLYTCILNVCI